MRTSQIKIVVDNKKVQEISYGILITSNQYNQDSTAEVLMIMETIKEVTILILIDQIKS